MPNLIFVDLELCRSYDHELLQILKNNLDLRPCPIIVMADSAETEEIHAAYYMKAACFTVLARDPELRRERIRAMLEFWSDHVNLPDIGQWKPTQRAY